MAVSYRIVIFLLGILTFGFFYSIVGDAVSVMDPMVASGIDSQSADQGYQWLGQMWLIAPVMVLIAGSAWLLKESVIDV
jgi:hypothetical protein